MEEIKKCTCNAINVRIEQPDGTIITGVMSMNGGEIINCSKNYITTDEITKVDAKEL